MLVRPIRAEQLIVPVTVRSPHEAMVRISTGERSVQLVTALAACVAAFLIVEAVYHRVR
jgi:hypothetical protein